MKKALLLAMVLLFGTAMVAMAGPNVANVTQQGSVLVFPKIDLSGDRDTLISISNGNNLPVYIKCYWMDKNQDWQDFMFQLTAYQPIKFSAKFGVNLFEPIPVTVPPFPGEFGELKCWAVNHAGDQQIKWNFLTGSAKQIDYAANTAYEYNAWSFAARTAGATGDAVGTGGNIKLDGVEFDACPKYFLGNFVSSGAAYGFFKDTDLTVVPCKEDLRQERAATFTKVKFDIWNENETLYTGATQCVKCWFEGFLSKISDKFTYRSLHTAAARFRAYGVPDNAKCSAFFGKPVVTVASPLVGLLVEYLDFGFGTNTVEMAPVATVASEGFASGLDGTGFIKWDTLNGPEENRQ